MGKIGKIFGRKAGQTAPLDGKKAEQPVTLGQGQDNLQVNLPSQEIFGLKLILSSGEEFSFTSLPISIGRHETNQIVLKDDAVSDQHALIYFDQAVQEVCILDQDSLNGTSVDHCPTRRNILYDGVTITLGASDLIFRDTGYIHNRQELP